MNLNDDDHLSSCTHVLLGKKPTRVVKMRSRMIPVAARVALHSERICGVTPNIRNTVHSHEKDLSSL